MSESEKIKTILFVAQNLDYFVGFFIFFFLVIGGLLTIIYKGVSKAYTGFLESCSGHVKRTEEIANSIHALKEEQIKLSDKLDSTRHWIKNVEYKQGKDNDEQSESIETVRNDIIDMGKDFARLDESMKGLQRQVDKIDDK